MNLWIGALHHTTAAMRFGRSTALSQIALRYAPWPSAHFALASARQNVIYARDVIGRMRRAVPAMGRVLKEGLCRIRWSCNNEFY